MRFVDSGHIQILDVLYTRDGGIASVNLKQWIHTSVEHLCATERVAVAVRGSHVCAVCDILSVEGHENRRQHQRKHCKYDEERHTTSGDPIDDTVEDNGAWGVATEIGILEKVRERREPWTSARVSFDTVAKVGVELHVCVKFRLFALSTQPFFLRAALIFAI